MITINFISSKDNNYEEYAIHSKSDNIEIMISDKTDGTIEQVFNLLKNRNQNNLQSMKRHYQKKKIFIVT